MRLHIELDDGMRALVARLPGERKAKFLTFLEGVKTIAAQEAREVLIDYLEDLQDTPGLDSPAEPR